MDEAESESCKINAVIMYLYIVNNFIQFIVRIHMEMRTTKKKIYVVCVF